MRGLAKECQVMLPHSLSGRGGSTLSSLDLVLPLAAFISDVASAAPVRNDGRTAPGRRPLGQSRSGVMRPLVICGVATIGGQRRHESSASSRLMQNRMQGLHEATADSSLVLTVWSLKWYHWSSLIANAVQWPEPALRWKLYRLQKGVPV